MTPTNGILEQPLINVNADRVPTLELILMLTLIGLLPTFLVMMTSFTRIIIILGFLRNAMGIQQTPPNIVLAGISIFLTLFIMQPVISEVNTVAYQPYLRQEITMQECFEKGAVPFKTFMIKNTEKTALKLFTDASKTEVPKDKTKLPLTLIVPAFLMTELKRAFMAGFLLYLPFMLIDIVVSSILMSMGMMMLPPAMISLPFKLLLFVVLDGWNLLFQSLLLRGYQ